MVHRHTWKNWDEPKIRYKDILDAPSWWGQVFKSYLETTASNWSLSITWCPFTPKTVEVSGYWHTSQWCWCDWYINSNEQMCAWWNTWNTSNDTTRAIFLRSNAPTTILEATLSITTDWVDITITNGTTSTKTLIFTFYW